MISSNAVMFLTQYQGKILGPFAWVLGKILNLIYVALSQIGIENVGLCIIIFTILVNALLIPFNLKQQKFSKMISVMQPEINKINEKYKNKTDPDSRQRMQMETAAVYQKYGVSPSAGCLPMLISLPIMLALYRVIYAIPAYVDNIGILYENIADALLTQDYFEYMKEIYSTVRVTAFNLSADATSISATNLVDIMTNFRQANWNDLMAQFPEIADTIRTYSAKIVDINTFIGGINILEAPGWHFPGILLPILAMATQMIQVRLMPQPENQQNGEMNTAMQSMKTMNVIMPIFSGILCISVPIGVGIFWVTGTCFRIVQQLCVRRYMEKIDVDDLIAKNQEKVRKRNEKLGIDTEAFQKYASQRTSNMASSGKSMAGKANMNVNKNNNYAKQSGNESNMGSIAQRAHMVSRGKGGREDK